MFVSGACEAYPLLHPGAQHLFTIVRLFLFCPECPLLSLDLSITCSVSRSLGQTPNCDEDSDEKRDKGGEDSDQQLGGEEHDNHKEVTFSLLHFCLPSVRLFVRSSSL
jgi:hypothetical protein